MNKERIKIVLLSVIVAACVLAQLSADRQETTVYHELRLTR